MNHAKPRKPFRILRTAESGKAAISYASRNTRDKAAERYAAQDGTIIALEFWDEKNRHDPLNEGWACEGLVHPPGGPTRDNQEDATTLLTRVRNLLRQIDQQVEKAGPASLPGDEATALALRDDLCSELRRPVEALDKLLTSGGALPEASRRRATVRATYDATTPPAGPDVMTLEPGSSLGDLIVVAVAAAGEHGVYTCRDCSQAFNVGQIAVIARHSGDDCLYGFHTGCADAYREGHTPLVVTVHADRTASVSGPPNTTVTVVTEL